MYLWRRWASQEWLIDNEGAVRTLAGDRLAVIEQPNRKRVQLEVAAKSQPALQQLKKRFRGRIQKFPRDWLKCSLRRKPKPIKVENQELIIPAGAAFGTGEHVTTAMSLHLLEKISREWRRGWSIVDLGTGSGILALAARLLGARRVIGIDKDPVAISTATQNARLNKIRGVQFRIADVRLWKPTSKIDIITANLFSDLLTEILPNLKQAHRLILSGILRKQEGAVRGALRRNKIDIFEVRRHGKWVAILAGRK